MAQQGKVIELGYGTPYGVDHPFSVLTRNGWTRSKKRLRAGKFKPYWGGAVIGAETQLRIDPGSY